MNDKLDVRLIAAHPDGRGNTEFVAKTMEAVGLVSTHNSFSSYLAKTKTSRCKRLFACLRTMPVGLVIALSVALLLMLSGTAYAAYRFWFGPQAQLSSVEQKGGRSQALIALQNCGDQQKTTVEYDGNGTADNAVTKTIADCERQAIIRWAVDDLGTDVANVRWPYAISMIGSDTVTVTNPDGNIIVLGTNSKTQFIEQGNPVKRNGLKPGDAIAYVLKTNSSKPQAIIKLSAPIQYYQSQNIQNTYKAVYPCAGNEAESCVDTPMLDVNRDGEGGANPGASGEDRRVQGELVSATPTQFKLRATSGTVYTFNTPTDIIGTFNKSNPYGNVRIEAGDVLEVRYSYVEGSDPQVIEASQYHIVQLLLKGFDKTADVDKNLEKYKY